MDEMKKCEEEETAKLLKLNVEKLDEKQIYKNWRKIGKEQKIELLKRKDKTRKKQIKNRNEVKLQQYDNILAGSFFFFFLQILFTMQLMFSYLLILSQCCCVHPQVTHQAHLRFFLLCNNPRKFLSHANFQVLKNTSAALILTIP